MARLPDIWKTALSGAVFAVGLPLAGQAADCPLDAEAVAEPGAMVRFDLSAPCRAGQDVTLLHEGLSFTETIPPDGLLRIDLPALADPALIVAAFADGASAVATSPVTGLEDVARAAIDWSGPAEVALISADDSGAVGHFGTHRGDDSRHLRVASFKAGSDVPVLPEVVLTPDTCDRALTIHGALKMPGAATVFHTLTLTLPPCSETTEGRLLLPQLFPELGD
ncbi:hypothetical protein KM176_08465 [Pseudooceanicola sp. CBS1P-1]|uniref:Uncharacterized protein n=1 Tax=Pseudooceanicola albus TaxID=2692189 RepID=A0A6L7FZF9_9RHOB|nr:MULTISPECIES: hypothetical protein [Pseudooceanicola]MBT9383887.1 hypothetical protein [Pseudooceanicola endophyticus]MXN16700.1 hypothetical protein [Pseudooceanicola albus]